MVSRNPRKKNILSAPGSGFGVVRRLAAFPVVAVGLLVGGASAQVQLSVGQGQAYTSIQKAVDACPDAGCVISLTDSVYPLPREVWIEAKNNLTIQPSAQMKALKIRPRLYYAGTADEFSLAGTAANPTDPLRPAGWKKWPIKGTSQRGPGAAGDTGVTQNPYSTSGFQNNGYLVIHKSTSVTIDGLRIDGLRPKTFVNKGIWSDMYDVFFGNVGINLFQSKNVVIRGTEIQRCFAAIYMQNRNVGGAFAAPNPNDLDKKYIVPYSQYGKMGSHLIERNYIHNNWYVFYDEMEWDIGSTIRYNLCDQNYNTQFAQNKDSSAESNNMTGGFMYLKDVRIVPHKIYNNTINGSSVIFGNSYFKPGVQHYFYNNLVTGWNRSGLNGRMISDHRQFLRLWKDFLYNNTFEVGRPDSLYQIQNEQSGSVNDAAACAAASQQPPCYLTWDRPVPVLQGIKNQWLWNGWQVAQGASYLGTYKGTQYPAANGQNIDFFGQGGPIDRMTGLGATAANVRNQNNYWARQIFYKSTTPGAAGFLEPQWDSSIVDTTVTDKGWEAAGNLDLDGSPVDRGAISKAGAGIISPLTLRDQFIVTLDKTARTVSFQYCVDATGTATDLEFELMSYYRTIALTQEGQDTPKPPFPAPAQLTNTGVKPTANSCGIFKATLPTAPVDSFARFDLVLKGNVDGKPTKSNVGVWVWRQTQYKLDVYFTSSANGTDTITSARVGDPVYMRVIGRRTDNNSSIPLIDVLAATPDKNMFLLPAGTQVMPGDTIGKNLTGGIGAYNVQFTQTGTATIALSGMVGNLPVPGAGAINIRPGLPEKAIWQTPPDWMYADRTRPLDSVASVIDQAPTPIVLQVVDKFGNNVDVAADVSVSSLRIDPAIQTMGFATTAAGPFTQPLTLVSDATGKVSGFQVVVGLEGQKYWGFANVVGKTVIDSALMKVGKPRAQLFFVPASKIDTFITVPQKVRLILSKNGTAVEAADPWSNSMINLSSVVGSKVYATDTSTIPLDSAPLAAGVLEVWVRSDVPLSNDTIIASNPWIGNGVPAVFAPVTFRMPPEPDAPKPKSGVFLDADCDGVAEKVFVEWLPKGATVRIDTLDPAKVKITEVRLYGARDSIVLGPTAVRSLTTPLKGIELTLPAASLGVFDAFAPSGRVRVVATLVRSPAADTVVQLGAVVSVKDGIGPRPIGAVIVENPNFATVADTLTVLFSEPVKYTGNTWPFKTFSTGMMPFPMSSVVVVGGDAGPSNSLKFILTGTAGQIKEGTILAIEPGAGITDTAGNGSRIDACKLDTALVAVKPVQVDAVRSIMFDRDGDGKVDRLRVEFRRDFRKASERPDSVGIEAWASVPRFSIPFASADSIAPAIWEIPLPATMPVGATVGIKDAAGNGNLHVYRGIPSALNPVQMLNIQDSVPPIAIGIAVIEFNANFDRLTVTYSEPMSIRNANAEATMVLQSASGDQVLVFTNPVPNNTSTVWTFDVPVGKLQVGDMIRLPGTTRSVLAAANGTMPSALGAAPYVPVVGGDRAPDSGRILDRNGDGVADAVRLFYTKAPAGNPTFAFGWAGSTRTFDSASYANVVAGRLDVTIPVSGWSFATSSASSTATSTSYVGGIAASALPFPLRDGIAPVATAGYVSYGLEEGAPDTLLVTMSEAGTPAFDAAALVLGSRQGSVAMVAANAVLPGPAANEFALVCLAPACQLPGFGDLIRLAPGSVTDGSGAVVGDSSAWAPVTTGPKPVRYAAAVYPKPVLEFPFGSVKPLPTVGMLSTWVRPEGSVVNWSAAGQTKVLASGLGGVLDSGLVSSGLVGVKIDLNTSFDGQFIVYDNIGTFVTKMDLKIDVDELRAQGLANSSNKYSLLVGLNGLDAAGKDMASGVYMIRVISFSEQIVNGQPVRTLQQNKVFKVGLHNKFK